MGGRAHAILPLHAPAAHNGRIPLEPDFHVAKKRKAKKAKKRNRAAAPSTRRSTGGAGFAFEDQVAAYYVLTILAGQPLPGVEGNGVRLQMQTESLGWLVDDVLLTTTAGSDDDR